MTGFNVVTNISNREHDNTLAGFTKADVERAIDELLRDQPELQSIPEVGNREQLITTLETSYDGHRFSPDANEDGWFAGLFEWKYLSTDTTDKQLADKFEATETQLQKYLSDKKFVGALSKGLELKAGTIVFGGCSRQKWRAHST